jgi:DcuC family C4-dicarboxylate transporter
MSWEAWGGLLIIALVLLALARGGEVRFVLLLGAFALAGLTRHAEKIVITFFQGLADPTSLVPICSAMGFAYVLRAFECDQHLVRALAKPLLRVRWMLVPGTVCVGFMVNITIISQTSTALAVGTVLIPLLRSLGIPPVVAGSGLLLGSSLGGELLNPGAPELVAIAKKLNLSSGQEMVPLVATVVFIHLAVAIAVFVWWTRHSWRSEAVATPMEQAKIDWLKALVPIVPLALLFLFGPPLNLLTWPGHWLVGDQEAAHLYGSRLIGLAMILGVIAACLVVPKQARTAARHFFEGAGFGYTHIISLIVIAKCFSDGITYSGVANLVGDLARYAPVLLVPLAGLLPLCLAYLSGSGIGATQGLYPLFAGIAEAQGLDGKWIGVVTCIGSAAGRTMSPVAAVTNMCGKLTEVPAVQLSRSVAIPLLVGMVVVIGMVLLRVGI